MERFAGVLGMLFLLGLAYLFSTARKAIRVKNGVMGPGPSACLWRVRAEI